MMFLYILGGLFGVCVMWSVLVSITLVVWSLTNVLVSSFYDEYEKRKREKLLADREELEKNLLDPRELRRWGGNDDETSV